MATHINAAPNLYSPLNNLMWFEFADSNNTQPQFQYLINVYQVDETTGLVSTDLGQYKIPPRNNGNGPFSPHKILQSQIEISYSNICQYVKPHPEQIVRYRLIYGFEYDPLITYNHTDANLISGTYWTQFYTDQGHPFQVGDTVTIQKDINTFNAQLNGDHQVIAIGSNKFTIDVPFFNGPVNDTGSLVMYNRIDQISSDFYAYNGTRQYDQVNIDFTSQFLIQGINSIYNYTTGDTTFLTNYIGAKPIQLMQGEVAGFIMDYDLYNVDVIRVLTYSGLPSAATTINNYTISITYSVTPSTNRRWEVGVGTYELAQVYGVDLTNVKYYTVSLRNVGSGATYKASLTRKIDNGCYLNDNVRIKWLNRHGAFEYWNFTQGARKTTNIKRNEYQQPLTYEGSGTWYSFGARGNAILSQVIQETFNIQTDWISEYDYAFLEELFTSPEVYLVSSTLPDASNIVTIDDLIAYLQKLEYQVPIILSTPNYIQKTVIKDKLFNISVDYKLASLTNIQNK